MLLLVGMCGDCEDTNREIGDPVYQRLIIAWGRMRKTGCKNGCGVWLSCAVCMLAEPPTDKQSRPVPRAS